MQLPARMGKYELIESLGGGMSRVYRARDTVLGRPVVVKILNSETGGGEEAKARFLQEARATSSITHENIVRIHDYGEHEGLAFMVIEFIPGQDLRAIIKAGNTDLKRRIEIALDVARGLEHIHRCGIIHRDIKPDNIRVTPEWKVKLMDFGIAKSQGLQLTRTGMALGTPYYMAPEQVMGKPVTPQSDVYAFGLVLFELFSGEKAVTGDTVEQVFYKILSAPLDLTPLTRAGLPARLVSLVQRCSAKDPGARPAGFAEVCRELEYTLAELAGSPAPAAPPQVAPVLPRPPKPLDRRILLAGGGAALVAAGTGLWVWLRPSRPPEGNGTKEPGKEKKEAVPLAPPPGMVLVPAGTFLFGANREQRSTPAFYIDRTEVPNRDYQQFCNATGRALPPEFAAGRPDEPVVNVTFEDAQAYAAWAGKRLPSGLEWEKAARGTEGFPYPWGADADPARANVAGNPETRGERLVAVDRFENGASPFQVLNMAGNVWEWVDGAETPSARAVASFASLKLLTPPPTAEEPWRAIRGGSYKRRIEEVVAYEWSVVPARFRFRDIGFRCAMDAAAR